MRILVVEDYAPLRHSVVQCLREAGYAVDECERGDDGISAALSGAHDLILLDLMLPGIDGFEFLRQYRAAGRDGHVLVMTARNAVDDRVRGLDTGADDYLVKPFAVEELLARVRALLRREYQRKSPTLRVGHLELDTRSREVRVAGAPVELTAKEYGLLEYLALRAGELVSRADIWEHVYDERSQTVSNVVDVYIGYLRKKINVPGHPRLIVTRRGLGYMLVDPGE